MASSQLRDCAVAPVSLALLIGGGLLLASVVITVIALPPLLPYAEMVGPALFSAALLVFAFGVRGEGSVTARRPVGTITLALLAVWLLLGSVLYGVIGDDFSNRKMSTFMSQFL